MIQLRLAIPPWADPISSSWSISGLAI